MNKLTVIGYLSNKHCYLNLSEQECIKRYCEYNNLSEEDFQNQIHEIDLITYEFKDEFYAYDAWNI